MFAVEGQWYSLHWRCSWPGKRKRLYLRSVKCMLCGQAYVYRSQSQQLAHITSVVCTLLCVPCLPCPPCVFFPVSDKGSFSIAVEELTYEGPMRLQVRALPT